MTPCGIPLPFLSNIVLLGSLGATAISLGIFLYLSNYDMSEASPPGNNGPGQVIAGVRSIRLAIFTITTVLIAACAVFNVIDFNKADVPMEVLVDMYNNKTVVVDPPLELRSLEDEAEFIERDYTDISPVYLFLCGLSLSAISAFLRAGFILKLSMMIVCIIIQSIILYTSDLFETYDLVHKDSM